MKRIYLDYASLTPIDPRVIREMKAYSSRAYANPSSLYKEGIAAKKALAEGRAKVAAYLNAHTDEIGFTSGGTEANALALEGVGRAAVHVGFIDPTKGEKPHFIISAIEHSSIIETANMLEKHGCEITRLPVDANGVVMLDELKKSIKSNTVLVSIMMVNNEIGSIQPIKEIAKIVRDARKTRPNQAQSIYPLLHTDAAQALYEEINMDNLGVDLLTLDGGKVYGPRGIGALYVKRSVIEARAIEPIIYGGGQERGLRSGTENLPAIMGFAKALEITKKENEKREGERNRLSELKSFFIDGLKAIRPDIKTNGDVGNSAPHILNVSIPGIDNEFLLFQLDAKSIACSTKSSCLRDEDESYVLKSIGADSRSSLRFSFGRWTTKKEIIAALKIISQLVRFA